MGKRNFLWGDCLKSDIHDGRVGAIVSLCLRSANTKVDTHLALRTRFPQVRVRHGGCDILSSSPGVADLGNNGKRRSYGSEALPESDRREVDTVVDRQVL